MSLQQTLKNNKFFNFLGQINASIENSFRKAVGVSPITADIDPTEEVARAKQFAQSTISAPAAAAE